MKWSAAFATGVPEIDRQHQTLFNASEDYRSALDAGQGVYGVLLEFLDGYARAHFGFEEQCLHRHQCPAADENAQAHREFVLRLGEFRNSFGASGFERQEAFDLLDFVDDWLASHVSRIDTQLRPCVALAESGLS